MSEHIRIVRADRVLSIEFNRPEKKNALTAQMYGAISSALQQADADSEIRCILIHGQADCFTAGNDLQDFLDHDDGIEDTLVDTFLTTLPHIAKPIVAAVGGPAIGIGTTMLLHCDLVYAASNAKFCLPFINLAVVPEAASSMLLPRLTGYQRAAELLLLGEPFDANRGGEVGFVTQIVEPEDLLEQARAAASVLAGKPPAAMLATKALLKRGPESVASRIKTENELFSKLLGSAEAKEAMSAFFERRAPDYSKF